MSSYNEIFSQVMNSQNYDALVTQANKNENLQSIPFLSMNIEEKKQEVSFNAVSKPILVPFFDSEAGQNLVGHGNVVAFYEAPQQKENIDEVRRFSKNYLGQQLNINI